MYHKPPWGLLTVMSGFTLYIGRSRSIAAWKYKESGAACFRAACFG